MFFTYKTLFDRVPNYKNRIGVSGFSAFLGANLLIRGASLCLNSFNFPDNDFDFVFGPISSPYIIAMVIITCSSFLFQICKYDGIYHICMFLS